MLYKKVLLLILIIAAMWSAYQLQQYFQVIIQPKKSLSHLFLFLLISCATVFVLAFIAGFTIIYFNNFFFEK